MYAFCIEFILINSDGVRVILETDFIRFKFREGGGEEDYTHDYSRDHQTADAADDAFTSIAHFRLNYI